MNDVYSVMFHPPPTPPRVNTEESTSVQLSVRLRLWQSTVPKLNTVLFISLRLPAKCAVSISLLTSFHHYDRFSDAPISPSFTVKPFTDPHTSICARSFRRIRQFIHQIAFKQTRPKPRTHTHTHTHRKDGRNEIEMKALLQYQSLSNPFCGPL